MKSVKELQEERASIWEQQKAILDEADKKGSDLTSEEEKRYNDFEADFAKIEKQIEQRSIYEKREAEMAAKRGERLEDNPLKATKKESQEDIDKRYAGAWEKYMRYGIHRLSSEERTVLERGYVQADEEMRAQSVGTTTAGGYTVPEGFSNQLEEAMLEFGGVRQVATVIRTASGNALPWPTTNDTAQKGEIIAENAQANEQDITFGVAQLDAYLYSSKIIRVSVQLLQDSAFNMNEFVPRKQGERIARITNEHFTTGTGTGQPNGIVTASTLGVTAVGAAAITSDELIDLEHSVDPAYRAGASFMFNDAILAHIKKLKDGDGNYLWNRGNVADGVPATFMGYRYTINQDMPALATGLRTVLFGDLSKYHVRDVLGITAMRLTERYADFHQVGFLAFSRHDGELIDAGTNPVKHLIQA